MKNVTVLMSAYNHERFVGQAIESVLGQTYRDFYFMVADDNSLDGTPKVIMEYESQIDEIHLFDENSGHGRIPEMLATVTTPYVAVINSDDYWNASKLQKQMEYMEDRPECAACFTWTEQVNDAGDEVENNLFYQENHSKEEWMRIFWRGSNCLAHPSVLIRTEIYKELLLKENLFVYRQIGDFSMWLKLVQRHEIHIIKEKLVTFRVHTDKKVMNISAGIAENQLRDSMEQSMIWYHLMKDMDDEYFKKAFGDLIFMKDASTREEIQCEKFFILSASPVAGIAQAAIWYYMDVMRDRAVWNVLEQSYGFCSKMFYELEFQRGYMKDMLKLMEEKAEEQR